MARQKQQQQQQQGRHILPALTFPLNPGPPSPH